LASGSSGVRDIINQKNIGTYANNFTALVQGHSVVMVKLFPSEVYDFEL